MSNRVVKKERNSSLELLRILCMLCIISAHYYGHGGYSTLTYGSLSAGNIFIQVTSMFGRISCSVFALISGYFLVSAERKNHYRKIVPLIAEMTFYSIVICLVMKTIVPVAGKDILQSFFPLMWGGELVRSILYPAILNCSLYQSMA